MRCKFCERPAWYRCARTGVSLCPVHARLAVVASPPQRKAPAFEVRVSIEEDYPRLKQMALDFWGETQMECFDGEYDVSDLPAFVASVGDRLVGFLSYAIERDALNIVVLNVLPEYQGAGVGKELVKTAGQEARKRGVSRLIVATSNDDLPALEFYQRLGFVIEEVVPGRILEQHGGDESGFAGIPVRDEVRLELAVTGVEDLDEELPEG
ncbi:MAG: GNAT family N-acetyltransferase [Anaerolineae bacterium]|nr:GNAT family N-acetyltransferase [Anaerolineae bacterium]NIN97219.1 GNAT family N-acetyltransferase [Anaerolineae bacterium]NIQ80172.1 GNAT family N-acetyltransferase [Anaerolineae bacterium]